MARRINPPLQVSIGDNRPWQTWFLRLRDALDTDDDALEALAREIAATPRESTADIRQALADLRTEIAGSGGASAEVAGLRSEVESLRRELALVRHANQSSVVKLSDAIAKGAFDYTPRPSYGKERWVDINFDVASLNLGASSPTFSNMAATTIQRPQFSGVGVVQQVYGSVELDHGWKVGSPIYPHIHLMPTTSGAGSYYFGFEYVWLNVGQVVGASTTITFTQAASGVAWQLENIPWPAIPAGSITGPNSQIMFRIFRDSSNAADTYGDGVQAATFGIHVLLDDSGSRARDLK